jgi:DNA invertase Pin-like site-specific DNA recombinase
MSSASSQQPAALASAEPAPIVVGYSRVSTFEQGDTGLGLQAQRAVIESECLRRGWQLARIDEDILSGKTMKRPGLQAALASCRSGEAAGLVVAKLDRLSRSVVDFAKVLEEARQRGFNLSVLDLGLDLATPQGELVANVVASVAQWERRMIGQRTTDALAIKRQQGVRLGRPPVLDRSVVTKINRDRRRGSTFAAIAERLNRAGVPTAHDGKCWYPATVRDVVVRAASAA